ncbi:hypothetical protein J0Q24_001157 [Vibrio cholerae]|nr:hypothetical protein [Vibrio cholerae]ELD8764128.1 hypothetical protein [Vibrio cholerae]ELT5927354.1 hypothetical protein [Vibrio cholerae]
MQVPEKSINLLKVYDLFEFMDKKLPVYLDQESKTELIYTKSLVDHIGLDWKSQRRKLLEGDNPDLYTIAIYKSIADSEGQMTPENDDSNNIESDFIKTKEGLYIPLESVQMYLARILTAQVRSQGNETSAEFILSLQKEWKKALHCYESHGIAIKQSLLKQGKEQVDLLIKLQKLKKDSQDPKVRTIADYHLDQILNELGLPVEEEKKQA